MNGISNQSSYLLPRTTLGAWTYWRHCYFECTRLNISPKWTQKACQACNSSTKQRKLLVHLDCPHEYSKLFFFVNSTMLYKYSSCSKLMIPLVSHIYRCGVQIFGNHLCLLVEGWSTILLCHCRHFGDLWDILETFCLLSCILHPLSFPLCKISSHLHSNPLCSCLCRQYNLFGSCEPSNPWLWVVLMLHSPTSFIRLSGVCLHSSLKTPTIPHFLLPDLLIHLFKILPEPRLGYNLFFYTI